MLHEGNWPGSGWANTLPADRLDMLDPTADE